MFHISKKSAGMIAVSVVAVLFASMVMGYFLTSTVTGKKADTREITTLYTTTEPVSTTAFVPAATFIPPIPVFTTAPATSIPITLYPGDTSPYTAAYTTLPAATEVYNILDDENIATLAEPTVIQIKEDMWYLALVNNQYTMPANHVVKTAPSVPGSDIPLEERVAAKYTEMYNAAAQEGIYLSPCSGYRSYDHQAANYARKTQLYLDQGYSEAEAKAKAAMIIMPPGCSEHNLGLAMDIIATDDNFYTTKEYAWLCAHAEDYGFILRYPKDKQNITKVEYEPWHWRYVGVDYAKAINRSNMCLEEYLAAAGLMPKPYVVAADGGVG